MLKKIDKKIEEYVTYKVSEYLANNNWEIISCNPPGSHGGICLLDEDRSKGGIIPDIIAKKGEYILIVESKPFFDSGVLGDINKLEKMNYNHVTNLAQRLCLDNNWLAKWKNYVQKAISLKTIKQTEISKIPKSYIIFVAGEESNEIDIIIGDAAIVKNLV